MALFVHRFACSGRNCPAEVRTYVWDETNIDTDFFNKPMSHGRWDSSNIATAFIYAPPAPENLAYYRWDSQNISTEFTQ